MNAAAQYGPGSQGGLMPAQQHMPYDVSASPPQQLDGSEHFHNFPQVQEDRLLKSETRNTNNKTG